MRGKLIFVACVLFLVMTGCGPTSYFGVPNKALTVPAEFGQTEAAIASAERSEGAKYCPEKIARARELAKEAAETYWTCHTTEAMVLLAEARKLAKEAESCQPSPEPRVEEKVSMITEPKIIILAFEDIHFDFDKSTLTPEAQTILKRNVQMLKDNPKAKVRIAGYTSASGTEVYNQKLSEG